MVALYGYRLQKICTPNDLLRLACRSILIAILCAFVQRRRSNTFFLLSSCCETGTFKLERGVNFSVKQDGELVTISLAGHMADLPAALSCPETGVRAGN